jgi:hypothetical protein
MNEDELLPTVYSGRWLGEDLAGLPAASVRAMTREDIVAQRAAEEAEAAAEDRLEGAQLVARQRGIDTSLEGVFGRALMAAKADDFRAARSELKQSIVNGEIEDLSGAVVPVSRSVDVEDEIDRVLERASEQHRWLVAYQARHDPAGAEAKARAKSERGHGDVRRSQSGPVPHGPGEMVRVAPGGGTIVRDTANAIVSVY